MDVPSKIALQGKDKITKYIEVKEKAEATSLRVEKSENTIYNNFKEIVNVLGSKHLWDDRQNYSSIFYNIKNKTTYVFKSALLLEELIKDTRKKTSELIDIKRELELIENELESL